MSTPVPSAATEKRDSFQLVGGHPALDLVNTLDWRFRDGDPDEFLPSYNSVLEFTVQSGLLTKAQARRVAGSAVGAASRVHAQTIQLREAASEIFYATLEGRAVPAVALKTLEGFFKAVRQRQQLGRQGLSLKWDWASVETAPELPFWLLCRSVERLMLSAEMQWVRACGNWECRWLFLDSSKNRTRRWCDMKICGNRMKARRFKAQHRG